NIFPRTRPVAAVSRPNSLRCRACSDPGRLITVLLNERGRRHLAEVQSRQHMAELAHINRYSTAGELTASIAHEINQPLGAILVNAETAQSILTSSRP